MSTHIAGHTLDLVISRTHDNCVLSCEVSDFISDHNAILVSLKCGRPHPKREQISYRKIKSIDSEALIADIESSALHASQSLTVDNAVQTYNNVLSCLFDKHAPVINHTVVVR